MSPFLNIFGSEIALNKSEKPRMTEEDDGQKKCLCCWPFRRDRRENSQPPDETPKPNLWRIPFHQKGCYSSKVYLHIPIILSTTPGLPRLFHTWKVTLIQLKSSLCNEEITTIYLTFGVSATTVDLMHRIFRYRGDENRNNKYIKISSIQTGILLNLFQPVQSDWCYYWLQLSLLWWGAQSAAFSQ